MDLSQTQRLILEALDGGPEEVGDLLEHLRPRLVLWAASRMSSGLRAKAEPEDVAQETLLAVSKAIGSFRSREDRAFLAWLFHIAENRIRDLAAHHGAQKRQPGLRLTFSQTSPSTAAARHEQVERVRDALTRLPEDYCEVIRLRRIEERDVREIAELMGRTENAVRILYCRALKALRAALEAEGAAA